MQGPNYLDLAKNLADAHFTEGAPTPTPKNKNHRKPATPVRDRIGQTLIRIGERLVPTEVRLETGTGPPC